MEMEELYKFKATLIRELKETINPLVEALKDLNNIKVNNQQLQFNFEEELPFAETPKIEESEEVDEIENVDGDAMYIEYSIKKLIDYDKATPVIDDGIITLMTSKKNHVLARKDKWIVRMSMKSFEFCGKTFDTYEEAINFRDRFVKNLADLVYSRKDILNTTHIYQNCKQRRTLVSTWLDLLHYNDSKVGVINE